MCGRLNVTADPLTQLLMEAFGIAATPAENHNLAPTEALLVIRDAESVQRAQDSRRAAKEEDRTLPGSSTGSHISSSDGAMRVDELRWWLTPSWSAGPSTKYAMFNAKSESLLEKRSFARPFKSQRCVIPVTGYYEWQKGQREKLPFYVHGYNTAAGAGTGLLLAGLWDCWTDRATGEVVESCSIVTAAASAEIAFLHHRQPVFLAPEEAYAWLDHRADVVDLGILLQPHLAGSLQIDPVSTYVNNARHKDERCTQPIADSLYVHPAATLTPDVRTEHPEDLGPERDLFD